MASNFSNGSAYKAMMDKDDSSWKYPGEYGRVSAWVKRTHRDLELEKDIYGHPPPVVFEKRQEKFIHQETIDVPHGFEAPPIGHFYVTEADDRWHTEDQTAPLFHPGRSGTTRGWRRRTRYWRR